MPVIINGWQTELWLKWKDKNNEKKANIYFGKYNDVVKVVFVPAFSVETNGVFLKKNVHHIIDNIKISTKKIHFAYYNIWLRMKFMEINSWKRLNR